MLHLRVFQCELIILGPRAPDVAKSITNINLFCIAQVACGEVEGGEGREGGGEGGGVVEGGEKSGRGCDGYDECEGWGRDGGPGDIRGTFCYNPTWRRSRTSRNGRVIRAISDIQRRKEINVGNFSASSMKSSFKILSRAGVVSSMA